MGQPPPATLPHPSLPPTIVPDELADYLGPLNTVLSDVLTGTSHPLLGLGKDLWSGLATIVVIWTGLRIGFGGSSWRAWEIVQLLLTLWVPWVMLEFYDTNVPGMGMPFPMIIPGGANFIAERFVTAVPSEMVAALQALWADVTRDQQVGIMSAILSGGRTLVLTYISVALLMVLVLLLVVIFSFVAAQVIYALVAVNIMIFLGPVIIPFFVFQPLAFLFWGWFRALWTYSLYSVIAGVMLYVWSAVALQYIRTLNVAAIDFSNLGWSAVWFVAIIPMAVAAVLCATKVGELAGAIVSGGGAGGMNVAGMATTGVMMATGGAGKIAAVAGKPK